ncbi:hypothetical protein CTAYLR_002636 [Chrysophaeum taylorii]|uniref:Glycosyl transferase family 25 domain-containing protein n=1 Tax=Chrysophaeum taylorii TaxID=2483200 RepID=A0AAD7UDB7_9STRA|nr:hypothetical protein CTAYLR_002636 [Chrysophaeum taylorii]
MSVDARVRDALARAADLIRTLRRDNAELEAANKGLKLELEEARKNDLKAEVERLKDELTAMQAQLKQRKPPRKRKTTTAKPRKRRKTDADRLMDQELDDVLNSVVEEDDDDEEVAAITSRSGPQKEPSIRDVQTTSEAAVPRVSAAPSSVTSRETTPSVGGSKASSAAEGGGDSLDDDGDDASTPAEVLRKPPTIENGGVETAKNGSSTRKGLPSRSVTPTSPAAGNKKAGGTTKRPASKRRKATKSAPGRMTAAAQLPSLFVNDADESVVDRSRPRSDGRVDAACASGDDLAEVSLAHRDDARQAAIERKVTRSSRADVDATRKPAVAPRASDLPSLLEDDDDSRRVGVGSAGEALLEVPSSRGEDEEKRPANVSNDVAVVTRESAKRSEATSDLLSSLLEESDDEDNDDNDDVVVVAGESAKRAGATSDLLPSLLEESDDDDDEDKRPERHDDEKRPERRASNEDNDDVILVAGESAKRAGATSDLLPSLLEESDDDDDDDEKRPERRASNEDNDDVILVAGESAKRAGATSDLLPSLLEESDDDDDDDDKRPERRASNEDNDDVVVVAGESAKRAGATTDLLPSLLEESDDDDDDDDKRPEMRASNDDDDDNVVVVTAESSKRTEARSNLLPSLLEESDDDDDDYERRASNDDDDDDNVLVTAESAKRTEATSDLLQESDDDDDDKLSEKDQALETRGRMERRADGDDEVMSDEVARKPGAPREIRSDKEYMQELCERLHTEYIGTGERSTAPRKGRKLEKEAALAHARRALRAASDREELAAALSCVNYGMTVHFPPFRVRKQSQHRAKIQAATANEKWSARHVVVEVLAWACGAGDSKAAAAAAADLFVSLASPTRLGRDTLFVAVRDVAHASLSWATWTGSLSEAFKRQLDDALAWHEAARPPEETMGDVFAALRDRLGLESEALGDGDVSAATKAIIRRSASWAREALKPDAPPLTTGIAAWLLVREDPLDAAAARARETLRAKLGPPEVARALLAAHSGEANDGACGAVVDWARRLPVAERAALPRRLLRRIADVCRRPRARVINLAGATRRRKAMARLALVHGLDLERCRAADAETNIPEKTVAATWSRGACETNARFDQSSRGLEYLDRAELPALSATERACAASHVEQWRRARGDGEPVIIFEDDVVLAPGFSQQARAALMDAPPDADLVLFGYFFPGAEIDDLRRQPAAVLRRFLRPSYFWGLHAYALFPKGAAKLLRHLPVDSPADVFVARLVHDRTLAAYAVRTKLAKQRTQTTSSIDHSNRDDPGVTFDPSKRITYDPLDDLASHVW